jgi:CRISPR-associated protein Cas1
MSSQSPLTWTGDTLAGTVLPGPGAAEVASSGFRRWQSIESPAHAKAAESHTRFLYVVEQGTVVRRTGGRVFVTKKEAKLIEVGLIKLQGVLCYGNVQVSTQCMRALLEEDVWLSFFTRGGVYKGRLQPPAERGGKLRVRQWDRSRDPKFCLAFGRAVVRGKILGQKQMAAAYAKNYLAETLGDAHSALCQSLERIETVETLDELRGVEGAASRAYFDLFRRWNRSEMPFEGRHKRGATDPINALLNFGYTLLTRELEGFLEAAGLDPTIGFYHMADEDRPSLACDWVEEFRHVVVDRLVLNLINQKIVQPDHFEAHEEKGGLRMKPEGLRRFVQHWEKILTGSSGENNGVAGGFRGVFLNRLGALLDSLVKESPYRSHLEN